MTTQEQSAFDLMRATLQGVLNSVAHPDIALRAVLVNLAPVRKALVAADAIKP